MKMIQIGPGMDLEESAVEKGLSRSAQQIP